MLRASRLIPRLLALAVLLAASSADAQPTVVGIEVSGTSFRVTLSDGSVKQGKELAGAVLTFVVDGRPLRIRIAAVESDTRDKTGTVLLHDFRIAGSDTPLCAPDPDGKRLGFPLAGRSTPDGRWVVADRGTFELICTAGAQGKCVRFGYQPWKVAADGRPMRDYYNACTRVVRADYCGDGRSFTRDGTSIDVWDSVGIQTPDTRDDPAYSFEAGWGADGAVCVARTRIPENITLETLKTSCPRLAAMPVCDEGSARAAGALLFNRSR